MSGILSPVIGLSCYREQARWGPWDTSAALVPAAYVDSVTAAGGLPVLLPPGELTAEQADAIVARLDGLVLAGGADLQPAVYGREPDPATAGTRADRDAAELALLAAADRRDLPVLGVCRGAQVMAAAAGGWLIQHLPDVVGSDRHRTQLGHYDWHDARFKPGSRVAAILGERLQVNSSHHQAVGDAGSLTVTGWADDGTVEVVEDEGRSFKLGVQWHPEVTPDKRLFQALTDAARTAARSR